MSDKTFENVIKSLITMLIIISAVQIAKYLIYDTLFTLTVSSLVGLTFVTFLVVYKTWKD